MWGVEGSEGTEDTLSALHIASKTSEYALDTLKTEYKTIYVIHIRKWAKF